MTDKTRARLGLIVVGIATVLTTLSLAIPSLNTVWYTLVQIAFWIGAAALVIPFYMKRRVASMDEYKCSPMSAAEARKKLAAQSDLTVQEDEKGYRALYVQEKDACSEAWVRRSDDAFWAEMKAQHPDAEQKNVTACYLLIVKTENEALNAFLKEGGCEAHVTDAHTRIRVSAAFVTETGMLYVARPAEEERVLFDKQDTRISTDLSRALRA